MQDSIPSFAVVGHPNRGKSSIVSTLIQNSRVPIDSMPGTTTKSSSHLISLGSEDLVQFFDTPGFQRPHKVFNLIKEDSQGADSRHYAVRKFALKSENKELYPDEVELLRPIVDGAGIIYVVDGSIPYGEEFDAELEILRWTGQVRMALINPIDSDQYVENWKSALGQFFNVVRVFDAHRADFNKQLDLLRDFAQLNEGWRPELLKASDALLEDRKNKIKKSSEVIAQSLTSMLSLKLEESINDNSNKEEIIEKLEDKLSKKLVSIEAKSRKGVESIFSHRNLECSDSDLWAEKEPELFSEESSQLFGLDRKTLLKYGAFSGAAVGGTLDVISGGSSLLMGSFLGGLVGAGTVIFGGDTLAETKVVFLPLGRKSLQVGPVKNISFPHLVLNRAWSHLVSILGRNHSRRGSLDLRKEIENIPPLSEPLAKKIEKEFSKIRSGNNLHLSRSQIAKLLYKAALEQQKLS